MTLSRHVVSIYIRLRYDKGYAYEISHHTFKGDYHQQPTQSKSTQSQEQMTVVMKININAGRGRKLFMKPS